MATLKLYLNNAAAAVTPTVRGTWTDSTPIVTKKCSTSKDVSGNPAVTSNQVGNGTSGNTYLMGQFVSDALGAAGVFPAGGAITGVIGIRESSTSQNLYLRMHVFVVNTSDAVVGTLLNNFEDAEEAAATANVSGEDIDNPNGTPPTIANTVTFAATDRLVIEIGGKINTTNTSYTATLYYGGSGNDLGNNGDSTTLVGFVNFNYEDAPTVTVVSPVEVAENTTCAVTLTGTDFLGATGVTVGGHAASSVSVVSRTSITCTLPAHDAEADLHVVVTTPAGSSAEATANHFAYYEDAIHIQRKDGAGGSFDDHLVDHFNLGTWTDVAANLTNGVTYYGKAHRRTKGVDSEYSAEDDVAYSTGASYPVTGVCGVVSGVAGTVASKSVVAGVVASVSGVAGAVFKKYAVTGAIDAVSSVAGTVYKRLAVAGASDSISGVAGTVTSRLPVAGVAPAQSSVAGAITAKLQTAGVAAAVSEVAGSVTSRLAVAGAVNALAGVSGTVTSRLPVAGFVATTSGTAGAITSLLSVAGACNAVSGATGDITKSETGPQSYPVSGTVAAVSGASGFIFIRAPVAGAVAAESGVAGTVFVRYPVAGETAAASGVAGTVTKTTSVSGTVAAVSGVAGAIYHAWSVAGVVEAVSGVSGVIILRHSLSGVIAAVSGAAGTITSLRPVSGAATAQSGAVGLITALRPVAGVVAAVSGAIGRISSPTLVAGVVAAVSGTIGNIFVVGPHSRACLLASKTPAALAAQYVGPISLDASRGAVALQGSSKQASLLADADNIALVGSI
jgi:hypothetical protein